MTASDDFYGEKDCQQVSIPTADSHQLIVNIYGSDHLDTVVLLHGLGADSTIWNQFGLTSLLVEHSFRVISFDLRGHGRSASLPAGQHSVIHSCLADLALILTRLEVRSCHLVGHSLGGVLALLAPSFCPVTDYVGITALSAHCYRQDLQKYRDWLGNDLSSWISWVAEELGVDEATVAELIGRHRISTLEAYVINDQTNFSSLRDFSTPPTFVMAGSTDPEIDNIQQFSDQFKCPINILKGVGHVGVLGQLDSFKSDLLWHLQGTFGLFSDRLTEV